MNEVDTCVLHYKPLPYVTGERDEGFLRSLREEPHLYFLDSGIYKGLEYWVFFLEPHWRGKWSVAGICPSLPFYYKEKLHIYQCIRMENFLSISTVNNASQVHMLIYKVIKLSNFSLQMHYSKCTSSYVSFSALA